MRLSSGMCSSFQIPRSLGVMRPSGLTELASVMTRPAPPIARLPRWTRCQSFAKPSMHEYSHMGETAIRLGRVRLRSLRGAKRWSVGWLILHWMWLKGFGRTDLVCRWFFARGFRETGRFLWFFAGEVVVECVVSVVRRWQLIPIAKIRHVCAVFCVV